MYFFQELTHCKLVLTASLSLLTSAPSNLKMADAPMLSEGPIFLLQRRRRNVSEERSFWWNFHPIREENSQPSGSPVSFF